MSIVAMKAKHWILRHYVSIDIGLFGLAMTWGIIWNAQGQAWLAILGVPVAFLVGAQKQKREELELFRGLFKEFNERYDGMNAKLHAVLNGPEDATFSVDERILLFDYFNLCGEEYLYYAQGYIYLEVWNAWQNGMSIFRKSRRIRGLWDEELGTGSYYGLTFDDQEETNINCANRGEDDLRDAA